MTIQSNIYNYFTANHDLHVLFVFDPQGDIRAELDGLEWNPGFRYVVFDGTWFSTKYAIANEWSADKVILLMPCRRPETTADMLNFPLMNVLASNMEYLTESDEIFLQQHGLSNQFRAFVQRHISELQLEKFNQILEPFYASQLFSTDMAFRGLLSGYLAETRLLEWNEIALRLFMLPSGDQKKSKAFYNALYANDDVLQILNAKLQSMFGQSLTDDDDHMKPIALSIKYNAITQLLTAVEADNYKRFKISSQGCLNQINDFMAKAIALPKNRREQFFETFERLAAEIRIPEIIANYGIDANYFYIPKDLCWEILKVIIVDHLATNPSHALEMLYNLQLKQENHDDIQTVIRFCINMANYYDIKRNLSTLIFNSPDDYIDLYVKTFYLVDQSYRKALEEWQAADYDAPVKEAMDESKRILDEDYAKLANQLNANWLHCLTETQSDFYSLTVNRQQDFFKKEVVAQTKQVVIVSDALRYEVAVDLLNALMRGKKYEVSLSHALAMLPTETKFCKPALLPHDELRIFSDPNYGMVLSVDGKSLNAIEKRTEHLQLFKPDAECVDFKKVMNATKAENRELFKKSLVYIYHQTIDEAGHSNDPVSVIKACSRAVDELALLVSRLQNNLAVVNVTITADHGFLYNDRHFEDKDKQNIVEETLEKSTRYYITKSDAQVTNVVKFPIDKVSAMNGDVFVAVPSGTNRFAIQGGGYNFVHGGASLQELIIPVISSHFNRTKEKQPVGVTLVSKNLNMVSSRLRVQLIQSEAVSADYGIREITVAVYAADKPVTNIVSLTLDNASVLASDRITTIDLTLSAPVSSGLLQLRVLDVKHPLNPLITETVTNNTLIETDF